MEDGSGKEAATSTKTSSSGSDPSPGPGPCTSPYLIDLVLRLVRICSVSSQRTKIYLQTVQLLPSAASPSLPASLGSVLSTGGAPLLEDLRPALVEMVATARRLGLVPGLVPGLGLGPEIASLPTPIDPSPSSQLVRCLLDHIQLDCTNMARRDLAAEWRLEGGFAPTIFKDRALLDRASLTLPSPALAVWFTTVLLSQIHTNTNAAVVLERLSGTWCLALRSPSMAVKTCAMKVLAGILQASSQTTSQSPSPSQLVPYAHRLQVNTLL